MSAQLRTRKAFMTLQAGAAGGLLAEGGPLVAVELEHRERLVLGRFDDRS